MKEGLDFANSSILDEFEIISWPGPLLLMEETLHQLIRSLSHYSQGLYIPGGAWFLSSTVWKFKLSSFLLYMHLSKFQRTFQLLSDSVFIKHLPIQHDQCLSIMAKRLEFLTQRCDEKTQLSTSVTKGMKGCNSFNVTCHQRQVTGKSVVPWGHPPVPPPPQEIRPY